MSEYDLLSPEARGVFDTLSADLATERTRPLTVRDLQRAKTADLVAELADRWDDEAADALECIAGAYRALLTGHLEDVEEYTIGAHEAVGLWREYMASRVETLLERGHDMAADADVD